MAISPPAAVARSGRPRDDAREAAILDAVLELLADVGYERMSVDAVAAHAHASKATIYRRWPGKADLVMEAMRRRHDSAVSTVDTGTLRGDLLESFRSAACTVSTADAALMAGVLVATRTDPRLAELLRTTLVDDKRAATEVLVARAVARGELAADADAGVAHQITASMIFFRVLVTAQPLDEAFFLHLVDDVLLPVLTRRPLPTTPYREDHP